MLLLPDADCEIDPWGATDPFARPAPTLHPDVLEVLLTILTD
jgi:hypothetical protein